jgi:hypothetical protein
MPMLDDIEPKDIQGYITDVHYPAFSEEIVESAKEHGAPDRVVTFLEMIPNGSRFESKNELFENLPMISDDEDEAED